MTATTVIQSLATNHLGIKLGEKDSFFLWLDCINYLRGKRKERAIETLQEAVAGRTKAFARLALQDALSQVLLGIDWPRRGLMDDQDIDTFPSLMRDALRRRGCRVPRPNVSELVKAA